MSRQRHLDPEQIAKINERIRETFDFARDVIDDPTILEEIPDGAELDTRHVIIDPHVYHIVAFRSDRDPDIWVARTTGRSNGDESAAASSSMLIRHESDISAKAAMDSVESALQAAVRSGHLAHQTA